MNGSFVFVLLIVTVVMSASVIKAWIKQKEKASEVGGDLDETLSKIDQLEERIKVLERIITENRFDLKNEIDAL